MDYCVILVSTLISLLTVVNGQCTDESRPLNLLAENGTVTSRDYPSDYTDTEDCQWIIESTQELQVVQLVITDLCTELNNDVIRLYDGDSSSSPLIKQVSGCSSNQLNQIYVTSQRFMFIRFTSDFSEVFRGFTADYSTIILSDSSVPGGAACSPTSRPLTLLRDNGTISSPNFPNDYVNNANCQWLITAPEENHVITLSFTDFCTEFTADIVNVYDGNNVTSPVIVSLSGCSSSLDPFSDMLDTSLYTSSQSNMFIKFVTDATNVGRGFNAEYITSLASGA